MFNLGFVQSEVKHFNTLSFNTEFLVFCVLSKNRRMVEVGRDLLRSSSPTPLHKQGQPEHVAQDRVQLGCEYLQGWSLYSLSGHLCQYLTALTVKKVGFFYIQMEFRVFLFNYDFGQ